MGNRKQVCFVRLFSYYVNNAINRMLELNIYPLQLSVQLTHNARLEIELCAFNYFSINVGGGRV